MLKKEISPNLDRDYKWLQGLLAVGDNALADFRFFRVIRLVINNVPTSFSYNFRSNQAESSTVKINEYEATLIYFEKTGLRKLLWQTPDRYYIISASLSEENILKVAKSLGK